MKKYNVVSLYFIAVVAMCFFSCSKENETDTQVIITPTSISMYYKDTKQLSATNATSWRTEDDFVAKVDMKGLVTAGHVGTTNIIASNNKNSATCEITVKPKYNLYDTPILDWGASISKIKSQETHKTASTSTSSMLGCDYSKNSSNPCLVTYQFENDKLKVVFVYLNLQSYGDASNYLLERYEPIYTEQTDYTVIFSDANSKEKWKTCVELQTTTVSGTKLTSIMYFPASELPSMQTDTRAGALNHEYVQKLTEKYSPAEFEEKVYMFQ
ncbi:MAG: Ig-like domain-containing protein [Bacteroidaceae bacterium]|nr:Ig-like domain-containing protein [Bacteroidaceae bacterium]